MIRVFLLRYKVIHLTVLIFLNLCVFNVEIIAQIQNFFQKDVLKEYGVKEGIFIEVFSEIIQDHEGFIWMTGRGGLYRFDGHEFYQFPNDPTIFNSINAEEIAEVFEDSQRNIWVGTHHNGLKLLDRTSGKFIDFLDPEGDQRFKAILEVIEDDDGQIWVCTPRGLGKVDQKTQEIKSFPLEYSQADPHILGVVLGKAGKLWIGTTNTELLEVDLKTAATRSIKLPWGKLSEKSGTQIWIDDLFIDAKDRLWIAASNGIFRAEMTALDLSTTVELSLMHLAKARKILSDEDGNLWMATNSGLLFYDVEKETFDRDYFDSKGLSKLSTMDTETLILDEQNNIWICDRTGNLYQLLRNQTNVKRYSNNILQNSRLNLSKINALFAVEDELYLGGYYGLLGRFNPYTHKYETLLEIPKTTKRFDVNTITSLYKDKENQLWIGTRAAGVWIYQIDSKQLISFEQYFKPQQELIPGMITHLSSDQEGNLLIASLKRGLLQCDMKTRSITKLDCTEPIGDRCVIRQIVKSKTDDLWMLGYYKQTTILKYAPSSKQYKVFDTKEFEGRVGLVTDISTIFEDRDSSLWIGTDKGLFKLEETQNRFISYGEENELLGGKVLAIQEDAQGKLWIASNRGIYAFDPKTNVCTLLETYVHSYIFQENRYVIHDATQQLFSANSDGLWSLYPPKFNENSNQNATFSKLSYYYKNGEAPEIDVFIKEKSKIEVPHQVIGIELQLSTLDHASSDRMNYKYALQRKTLFAKDIKQTDWIDLNQQSQINLASLSAGRYILSIKASTNIGNWEADIHQLAIHMLPPWWQSNLAYSIYLGVLAFLIYKIYRYQLSRQYVYQEALRLKEIDEFKSRFFTNISHEFRTPLTIISAMIDQVRLKPDQWLDKGAKMIKQNTLTLLHLVNQILELRKLDHNQLSLKLRQGDIVQYIRHISAPYQSHAENKKINLHFSIAISNLIMDYDPEKIHQVISNLLSNAIKFTPENEQIYLFLTQEKRDLIIQVKDTGMGIDEEQLPFIFDRFYQIDHSNIANPQGSGIGLALVKELVQLMKGKIQVSSKLEEGTTFTIKLPITQKAEFIQESIHPTNQYPIVLESEEDEEEALRESVNRKMPRLLIVEDNSDMRQVLIASLEEQYQIQIARNGQEGIEQAIDQIPDIIISDVMMPIKSGYELCDTLKRDFRTSHIPIILLTAKADLDSKLSGLEKGADVYLSKPFEEKELQLQLSNLLKVRKQLQERYRTLDREVRSDDVEDEFLLAVQQSIEENLDNTEYDTAHLCKFIGLSRAQLHKKLKALTGLSTAIYIRTIRLRKAKDLLMNSNLNVSEIAYAVGFKTPKYFSSAYKKEFGIAPSQILNNK